MRYTCTLSLTIFASGIIQCLANTNVSITTALQWQIDDRCLRRRLWEDSDLLELINQTDGTAGGSPDKTTIIGQSNGNLRGTNSASSSSVGSGRVMKNIMFNLKLHWEPGACWQEEWIERRWCMQCFGTQCESGDVLWIQECDDIPQQKFLWLPQQEKSKDNNFQGRLKTAYYDLCLEKIRKDSFELRKCDMENFDQLLIRSEIADIFEMYPKSDNSRCINQHHHPKANEFIKTTECALARKWMTSKWNLYQPSAYDASVTADFNNSTSKALFVRYPDCSSDAPCGQCEGDCDFDGDCEGDYVCYHRPKYEEVPGCVGTGSIGKDHCILPDTGINRLRLPYCTPQSPCARCEGDCQIDDDCAGNLRCFQRTRGEDVPGCSAGIPGYDFCYAEPTEAPTDAPSLFPTITISPSFSPTISNLPSISPTDFDPTQLRVNTACAQNNTCSLCEGHCTSSTDCAGNLRCFQGTTQRGMKEVPGCTGQVSPQTNYCFKPTHKKKRTFGCSESNPCTRCEGDCDSDSECRGSLVCVKNQGFIAGHSSLDCLGGGFHDFCYHSI